MSTQVMGSGGTQSGCLERWVWWEPGLHGLNGIRKEWGTLPSPPKDCHRAPSWRLMGGIDQRPVLIAAEGSRASLEP